MSFKKYLFIIFLCIGVSIIYVLPQMRFEQPNFIDIAETWSVGTAIWNNSINEFFNQQRFWPTLIFERSLMNTIFAFHPPFYFLAFSVVLASILSMVLFISNKFHIHWIVTIFAWVLLLVSPVTIDTFWRLGAAETLFTVLLVLSIYALIWKQYGWTVVLLYLFMGSKETAIFYIPIFLAALYILKKYKEMTLLGVGYILYVIKIYSLAEYAITHDAYTSMISRSIGDVVDMMGYTMTVHAFYALVFWTTLILFLYRIWKQSSINKVAHMEWGYIFLALGVSGLCPLIFFQNKFQSYYAFPWVVTIILWFVWEVTSTSKIIKVLIPLYVGVLFLGFEMPQQAMQRALFWHNDYSGDGALIQRVIKDKDSRLYSFVHAYRPELKPALDILYEHVAHIREDVDRYSIISTEEARLTINKEVLCGQTVFKTSVCKWAIVPEL